ncbi:hypothetical protein K458DRAFT_117781 [Lentithecium fluviatile CBS 122367]|uniref:Zn(2)-C6 fungal-type domain-containing protein n=1 Tax=Lentithecium fluviatile CBS 122367 TaxID=1168545 RepID=A0A6G1IM37_9PLEO|nr:hypothetical protein K458DRAFT_117781 [Lentithecium fluviatile CBS 122367]
MQSLTVSASVSKRKQACKSCRHRKRRCDAERPTCALCKKWGLKCEYTVPALHGAGDDEPQYSATLFGRQPFVPFNYRSEETPDISQIFGESFDLSPIGAQNVAPLQVAYPTPTSGLESLPPGTAEQDFSIEGGLPSSDTFNELVDIFFASFYHCFPCFHKASFLAEVQSQHLQTQSPLLSYAICAVAASFHPDPAVKSRQNDWYEQAKFLYEFTGRDVDPALRTIQAVLCLVFHAYTKGDFSSCWLFLGKAWRQIAAMAMNRIDSTAVVMAVGRKDEGIEKQSSYGRIDWEGKTAIEWEECRRTLWLLFMMDRTQSWPTGWAHAIDERHFKIDIPVTETVFQAMTPDMDPSTIKNEPFSKNLNTLIGSATKAKQHSNLFHYLIIAHVLLGRITELIHSLHESPDSPEYAQQCDELDASLVKLRLSLPRSATSVIEAQSEERGHVIWLNIILNSMSILINYRTAGLSSTKPSSELFALAVSAAKSTTSIIKDAARIDVSLLLSAHIASSIYMACCVLVIHWRLTGDPSCKEDIELFELVFERMNDVFSIMGIKFKLALKRDLERKKEDIEMLRDTGFRGLLADCSKWGFVAEEVGKLGIRMS